VEVDLTNWGPGNSVSLNVSQVTSGVATLIGSTSIASASMYTLRSVIWGSNLWVYSSGVLIGTWTVTPTSGVPGVGGYYTDSNSSGVAFGHHDTTAPAAVPGSIVKSVFASSVSLHWQPTADDTNGIGLLRYELYRDGTLMGYPLSPNAWVDQTVSASTTYTYAVDAVDQHGNVSPQTSITLTTPSATAIDPRRPGVRTDGAYWGGGGEQIDLLAGNLNFSVPLVTAQGRTGNGIPVVASYNSQNWRQDSGVNWQLGGDTGYGFGWRVAIGSVTAYYVSWTAGVDHYVFTDGTGAEYKLNVNSSGVWSSQEAIYLWFDANTNILHFKDGTFWVMGSTSGGSEVDAGAMYPTIIEDPSGVTRLSWPTMRAWVWHLGQPHSTAVPESCISKMCVCGLVATDNAPTFSSTRHATRIPVPYRI
jgi:chitodextrinase